jgi:ADP-ribose pyrophosphatase
LLDIEGEDPLVAAARELGEEVGVEADDWQVLVDIVPSPGIMDEGVRVYLARGLKDVGRQGDISDEEADLVIDRVPLTVAVAAAFRGEIVNAHAVAGLLAAQVALQNRVSLRPGTDAWDSGPALVRGPDEELSELPALSR